MGWSSWSATATPTDTVTPGDALSREVQVRHGCPDPLTDLERHRPGRIAQEHDELLATEAGRHVVVADRPDDGAGHGLEHLVACGMAIGVVEDLEAVDVDHQHADRVLGTTAPGQQAAELVEVAPVGQPGQGVGRGLHLGCPMRPGTRQGGRGLEGGAGQQPSRGRRPRRGAPSRQDDRADDAVARLERRGEHVGEPIRAAHVVGDAVGRGLGDLGRLRPGRRAGRAGRPARCRGARPLAREARRQVVEHDPERRPPRSAADAATPA